MMRLLSIGIDCVSSAIFVIPALAILQCTIYRKWEFKPFCVKLIFAFYAIAMFSVVGVSAIGTFQMDFFYLCMLSHKLYNVLPHRQYHINVPKESLYYKVY